MSDKSGFLLKQSGKVLPDPLVDFFTWIEQRIVGLIDGKQTFKKQWFVFKPSERLLLNYNKEEDALLGKVTHPLFHPPPPSALFCFAFVLLKKE
jgi:hypothetical protein